MTHVCVVRDTPALKHVDASGVLSSREKTKNQAGGEIGAKNDAFRFSWRNSVALLAQVVEGITTIQMSYRL